MNRDQSPAATIAADALSSLRPAKASEPDVDATQAYRPAKDTASRVLNQLDGLTASLEQVAEKAKPSASAAAADHADEECLESYLQRYMQQLTGKKQDGPATDGATGASGQTNQQSAEPVVPETKAPPRQPAQAPEDRLRITAMRELANDSARRAMAESTTSQLIDRTRIAYLVSKVLSLVSMMLVVCYFATHSTIALASGTVALGIAMLFACRFFVFCRKMGRGAFAAV
jgi:hypothetical protein